MLLLVTACGSAAPGATGSGGHTPAAGRPTPGGASPTAGAGGTTTTAQVSLVVTVYSSNNARPTQFTLRCDPPGGTVPDPAAACTQLLADPGLFAPRPTGVMCPMILAGGSHALVYGTYLGRPVDETIGDGGCDLPRWDELRQITG